MTLANPALKQYTITDLAVLHEIIQRALPRLDFFDNEDHALAGGALLWLVGFVGACVEYNKTKEMSD